MKKSEFQICEYGKGKQKLFIIYTDYKMTDNGPWHTRIYPDVRGNKSKAIKQAIQWLIMESVGEPKIIRNKPSKLFLDYKLGR
jgi:hypothetical protein